MGDRRWPDLAWMAGLVLIALAVRLVYFSFTHHIYGDAVQFARIAVQVLEGKGEAVDTSWFQCFCLWQVPFQFAVPDRTWAAGLSSMIPGALLAVPVFAITRALYNRMAAILAVLFCVFHPNLVNYSCNGYMESFYILCFVVAVWMAVVLFRQPGFLPAVVAGAASAFAFTTRNEFLLFFGGICALVLVGALPIVRNRLRHDRSETVVFLDLPPGRVAGFALAMMLSFGVVTCGYVLAAKATVGSYGIFEKSGNFGRHYDIFNQREQAAIEIYGGAEQRVEPEEADRSPGPGLLVSRMSARFANNVRVSLVHSLPRLLASPLYLFALVPVVAWLGTRQLRLEVVPVVMMLVFTPMLYSLIFVQARYLQSMLPPLHIFSAAGLVIAAGWTIDRVPRLHLVGPAIAGVLIVFLIALTGWRATRLRAQAEIHEKVSFWVKENVPRGQLLVGCGFGCISDTAFLSDNPSRSRIVTDDADDLAPFVRRQGTRWLIVYEQFVQKANPSLAPSLESGVPGFVKVFEATDSKGLRAQVHELKPVLSLRSAQ